MFQIFCKTISGKTVTLNVSNNSTIENVKQLLHDKTGVEIDIQRLIYAGRNLQDDHLVDHYGIRQDCTIHMVLRVCAGPAFGSVLLHHGITIEPKLNIEPHDCNNVKMDQSILKSEQLWSYDKPIVMTFDPSQLGEYNECLGPYSITYITKDSACATLKIYEPNGVCVINMKCDWIDHEGAKLFPIFSQRIMPRGGWKPNTEYRCEFLNYQKRGLKWTFKTSTKNDICLNCWQLNLSESGQICSKCNGFV